MKTHLIKYFLLSGMFFLYLNNNLNASDTKEISEIIKIITESAGSVEKKAESRKPARANNTTTVDKQPQKNEKQSSSFPSPDRSLLDSGIQLYEAFMFNNAKKAFEELKNNFPDSPYHDSATLWLAKLHIRMENYAEAEKNLNEVAPESGEFPAALFALGTVFLKMGDDKGAINYFYKVASDYPENEFADDSLIEISDIYLLNKKGNQALEPLIRIINEYPDRQTVDDAYYKLGQVFLFDPGLRDFSIAINIFKIFLKKAKIEKDPVFTNSPLLELVEKELTVTQKKYYGKISVN